MENIEKIDGIEQSGGTKENKMGYMPEGRLLLTVSAPLMLSMLIQALYNIVDSIFVAYYSQNALTAVSLVYPIQVLMIALGVGTGVGLNSLLSRRLGEKRFKEAAVAAQHGIFLSICNWLLFAVIGVSFSRTFLTLFTKDAEIIEMGTQYMFIATVFSFGCFLQFAFERIMQSTGKTVYSMIMQAVGAVINIILDPIFIFTLGLGVAGAAWATVIGQISAMVLGYFLNRFKNREISVTMRGFKINPKTIKEIYVVGFPAIIMQSTMSVLTVGLNKILLPYSDSAAAVVGVYFKLQSFVFMPVFGLTNGMVPIIAYNYGAGNKRRMLKTLKLGLICSVCIMLLGTLLFQLFPEFLLGFFKPDAEMLSVGVPALRIISICFAVSGVCIVLSTMFQSVGNGLYSLIVSVVRQLVVILPAAYIFAKLGGINAAWWAFTAAEVVAMFLSFAFYASIKRKIIDKIPDNGVE